MNSVLPQLVIEIMSRSKIRLLVVFAVSLVVASLEFSGLMVFVAIGDALLDADATPGFVESLLLNGDNADPQDSLPKLGITYIVLLGIMLPIQLWLRYYSISWMTSLTSSLHRAVVDTFIWARVRSADRSKAGHGQLMHEAMTAPIIAGRITDHATTAIWTAILTAGILIGMSLISPWLILIAVIITVFTVVFLIVPSRRLVERNQRNRDRVQGLGTTVSSQALRNLREIKSVGAEKRWSDSFRSHSDNWNRSYKWAEWVSTSPAYIIRSSGQIVFGGAIALAAATMSSDELATQMSTFAVFLYGMLRIYPATNLLGRAWIGLGQSTPYLETVQTALGRQVDELDSGDIKANKFSESIVLDNVSFSYNGTEPVLEKANATIRAGILTVIVGASGTGKSTLLDLLLKFETPTHGHIRVDGANLSDIDRRSWLAQIGLVSQEILLFSGSIRENLLAWNPNASQTEIDEACRRTGLSEFIDRAPDGYETFVGEHGEMLSGGQRQRLALARALLRNPNILILDEATNALDPKMESEILDNLVGAAVPETIVMATHREQSLALADQILVVEANGITAQEADQSSGS